MKNSTTPVRLADFILEQMEPILEAWEPFAKTIEPPALNMDREALRDHASHMLKEIAIDLGSSQTEQEQAEKSKARGPRSEKDTAAETHAAARLMSGYTIEQMVSEYRALRASVLKLWTEKAQSGLPTDPEDITRFNEAIDQALAESVARYAALVRQSQDLFLAILGHDLRNPLNATIMGASIFMNAPNIDEKYKSVARSMFNSGHRMANLVNDLIDDTRTHLGSALPIVPKQIDIAQICQHIVDELRVAHPERKIELKAPASLKGMWDEARMSQVLSSLIGNALQHGAKDESVIVTIESTDQDITATIRNKEVIDPKKIHTIFEPLVRLADQDDIESSSGTSLGIGLYIVREIVHAHGGTIDVESSNALGTNFKIWLPRMLVLNATSAADIPKALQV